MLSKRYELIESKKKVINKIEADALRALKQAETRRMVLPTNFQ